jgi:translocation and assembly module TamB
MVETSAKTRRSLPARIALGIGRWTLRLLVFAAALVGGLLLIINTPVGRRTVAKHVNDLLAPSFKGSIHIDSLGGLGLWGVSGANVTISDPTKRPVLVVKGARVTIATWKILHSVLFEKKTPMDILLRDVSIDDVDVRLDTDADGNLDLVDAFASTAPPSPPDPSARGLLLEIPHIALKHAWGHGQMAGAPAIDADLTGLAAALTVAPDDLVGDVSHVKLLARKVANGADVGGELRAHVRLPFAPGATPSGSAAWRGSVGGIANSLDASLIDDKIDAVLDVPHADPNEIRALWPASAFDQPATAHIEAHGPLSSIDISLHAGLGHATFDAKGAVVVADAKSAKLSLDARGIDIHELAASAPVSRLGLKGDVEAKMAASGALEGSAKLRFEGGSVGANEVPGASIRASGSRGANGSTQADLDVVVDEPGAPTHLAAHLDPNRLVRFALDSKVKDLYAIPELRKALHGSVVVAGKGDFDIARMTLVAELHANATSIAQGTTHVDRVTVDVTARGVLPEPHLDAVVVAQGVVAGGVRLVSARVHADGPPMDPHIDVSTRGPDTPDVDATLDLGLADGISIGDLHVALAHGGERALISARQVRVGHGEVHVDDATISGIGGDLTASAAMTPTTLRVRAATQSFDLARAARIARLDKTIQAGTLALDVDVDLSRTSATGRAAITLDGAKIDNFAGISAKIDAALDGRKVKAKLHGEAAGVATLDLDAPEVHIGGSGALSAASWRGAWGSVAIDAQADLAKLSKAFPPEKSPVNEARGTISIKGHVERDDLHDFTPDVALHVTTNGLSITPKTAQQMHHDRVLVMEPAPWTISGIDFQLDTTIDGETGALKFETVVRDTKGQLADVHVDSAHIPYDDVFKDTGRLLPDLLATTFDVHVVAPERDLADFPKFLQQTYATGAFKADITAKGTVQTPVVDAALSLVKAKGKYVRSPLNFDVTAHYDGAKGTASIKGASRGRPMIDAEAKFDAAIDQILTAQGDFPWTASAHAHLDHFPIQSLTLLNDKLVAGLLTGDASLDGLHKDARVKADLTIDSLSVGSVSYKGAQIHANADGKVLDASVRIDQTDGFVDAKAHAAATWGAALAPTLDPKEPLSASMSSKNFRVVALQPFVDNIFDELDGRLDANAKVDLDPKDNGAKLSGNIALRRGTIEAVAGGGEIHDITGNLKFAPDGTITLEKLSGFGLTGRFDATGVAHVSGTTLKSAKITVNIPHNAAIPVNAGGSEIGNVDGRIELSATGEANGGMKLAIGVPQLRVTLPDGSTTSAVSLGPIDKVSIGSHRGAPMTFIVIPIDPAVAPAKPDAAAGGGALAIQVNLGNVMVVRGTELRAELTGKLTIKSAATTEVTGQIHLKPGGTLTEQGKTFTIESGTVTFVGPDPSNPEIVVQASWTAPEGTVVYANFVGPLRTGKVTLRSEPALSRTEIVQLILFGTADGQEAQAPSSGVDAQGTALVAAGGEAAAPLNHALGQMGLGAVTAKIDTSETNPKPEVEVQIARDISLQIAVVLGIPPPGVNPDHTLLTIDWRFASKWSLASTVGDAGTTIFDLLWKRRY